MTRESYLTENAQYLPEQSRVALESMTDAEFDAAVELCEAAFDGTDPGMDCEVVLLTNSSLADFENARQTTWREPGRKTDLTVHDRPAVIFEGVQTRKGEQRVTVAMVAFGDRVVVLKY